MMLSEISTSHDTPKRFVRWTKDILSLFGPNITYSAGRKYVLRMGVSKIFLLNEHDYEKSLPAESSEQMGVTSGYAPDLYAYRSLNSRTSVDLDSFYRSQQIVPLDMTLGRWVPRFAQNQFESTWESVIFLCTDRIKRYAARLVARVPEVDPHMLQRSVFKIALTHEIGHHYTLANFSAAQLRTTRTYPDLNILEGLANWHANMFLTREERYVQAEMAIDQPVCYRTYLYLKHSDISALLDCFLADMDFSRAPAAYGTVIGGQHNLNGFMMTVGKGYDGIAMDWSGKGGVIVAGDSIKGIGTMNRGCFITPEIEFLIGRFPPSTLVISNEIKNIFDYGRLPQNVRILPRSEYDLKAIVNHNMDEGGQVALKSLLEELAVDPQLVENLTRLPYRNG
jgi:hypothetical protein